MVKRKGIDKITVKEIIDECRISRQTFYYHFQDIMEVIEWTVEQSIRQMLERSLEAKNLREALDILITCTRENRVLIRRLLDSQKREEIEKLLIQATRSYLREVISKREKRVFLNYSDVEMALDFWSYGISGLLVKYCCSEKGYTENLAEQICRLLPEDLVVETRKPEGRDGLFLS